MSVMKDSRKRLTTNHVSDELQLKEHIDERIQSWSNEIVKIDLKIPINSKLKVGLYAFNRNDWGLFSMNQPQTSLNFWYHVDTVTSESSSSCATLHCSASVDQKYNT